MPPSIRRLFCLFATSLTFLSSSTLNAQDTPPAQTSPTQNAVVEAVVDDVPAFRAHDEAISAHLSAILGQITGLSKVTHNVDAGLVTLRGSVDSLEMSQRAEAIASKLEHVIAVQNLIELTPLTPPDTPVEPTQAEKDLALKVRLTEIFKAIEGLEHIEVKVKSGIVTLSGEVLTDEQRTHAESLSTKVEGSVYVVNQISIPTEISERVRPAFTQIKELAAKTAAALPLLAIALVLLILTWLAARSVRNWKWPYKRLESRPLIRELVRQVTSTAVFVTGLLLIFELLDVTAFIGAILGTAGLAGLAVGFAFQDIVENYLASLMLSARQPYKKGDIVLIDGQTGKIMRMTMRDTMLMTFDGNHVRIPNAQIFKSVLTNYSHNPRRRFSFQVGIGTQENLLEARLLGLKALQSIQGVMKDPAPFMTIDELGDSNVVVTFYGWVDQREHDWIAIRSEAIRRVKVTFDQENFDMPEPIYRLQITERNLLTQAVEGVTEASTPARTTRPSEPVEDDTMQNSINEERHLREEIARDEQQNDERDEDIL